MCSHRTSNLRHRLSALQLAPDSLGFALDAAAQAVNAVRAGASLPAVLVDITGGDKMAAARGAVQDIAYRAMRVLATADALLARSVRKPPPPQVDGVLVCALALLLDSSGAITERAPEHAYSDFTVVDQAVSAVAARRETAFAKGLVNAVLRNFLRSRETLLAEVQQDPTARWNYPRWWIDAVRAAWPDHWEAVLAAGNTRAPLTLRVNRRRTSADDYLRVLNEAGIGGTLAGEEVPDAIVLTRPVPVDRLPGFFDGVVSVQDSGAQRAALLLGVTDGMRVLDACAAPGGKTGHLLECAELDLVAVESSAERATRITDNLRRLQLDALVKIGDAAHPNYWWDGKPFDRVLADVPCSASGIVRRHPDIRWLRRVTDIAALAAQQQRILDALWKLVAPGGELLYVSCSIFPEEGEDQARWFEGAQPDAVRLDAPGQLLPSVATARAGSTVTGSGFNHDGFFYARFLKR
jgi:16S rRNA (cytosine967-C5)-methyltransferase